MALGLVEMKGFKKPADPLANLPSMFGKVNQESRLPGQSISTVDGSKSDAPYQGRDAGKEDMTWPRK